MKKIFALMFLVLASNPALATDDDWKPAEPIRMAKLRGTIYKNIVERESDSVTVREEQVCGFEYSVAVYGDVADKHQYFPQPAPVVCNSAVEEKPVRVNVAGFVFHSKRKIGGELFPVKVANVDLYVLSDEALPHYPKTLFSSSATRDLAARSMLFDLFPLHFAGPDLPRHEENFSASVEFVDDEQ